MRAAILSTNDRPLTRARDSSARLAAIIWNWFGVVATARGTEKSRWPSRSTTTQSALPSSNGIEPSGSSSCGASMTRETSAGKASEATMTGKHLGRPRFSTCLWPCAISDQRRRWAARPAWDDHRHSANEPYSNEPAMGDSSLTPFSIRRRIEKLK